MAASLRTTKRVVAMLTLVTCTTDSSREIEYRGERIALTRSYADFDEYKNDTNNIAAHETEHVQLLVVEAPIETRLPSRIDAARAVGEIAFPGYGSGGFVEQFQRDGTKLMGFEVEIPRGHRTRYFVFLGQRDGAYHLIDDWVMDDGPWMIRRVSRAGDSLVFFSENDSALFKRRYRAP